MMSTVEMQIAERSGKTQGALTNLHQFIDEKMLEESFTRLNRQSSPGIDGEAWHQYAHQRQERIPLLLSKFKGGSYRAPHIRRVYIPKGDGRSRPLGLPTIEDKLLQTSVSRVLTPIYEQLFYPHSYGFRSGRSAHQALDKLHKEVSYGRHYYIIDADMENYFGSIDHGHLRKFLDRRIKDGVIRKMLDKWLKAGVLEGGQVSYPREGTPQGGSISPLLSNIYLHYVLDEWFIEQIRPMLKGSSFLIRYADDFILGFTRQEDAQKVLEVLRKRLSKYGLTLHPEKTKLITLTGSDEAGPGRFDFLGFTHYMGTSQKGNPILKRKTLSKKHSHSLQKLNVWLKEHRHEDMYSLIQQLNRKLRGYYGYYGITFNIRSLTSYHWQATALLHKWLNRRGGKCLLTWERFQEIINTLIPLEKPKVYHSLRLAKL